jgi:hypothetical protein
MTPFDSSRRGWLIALAFAFWSLASNNCFAITIERELWGFNGRCIKNQFNVLSVLVTNSTDKHWKGAIQLRRMLGNSVVGTRYATPKDFFVSPNSSRWVQFYPYIREAGEKWELNWGFAREERLELTEFKLSDPAIVVLDDPGVVAGSVGAGQRFPENLFPPHVTATSGLRAVFLDHVPRWEESRATAFIDWLYGGGEVHLLQSADGKHPTFPAELQELNVPADQQTFGRGRVVRHALVRGSITPGLIRAIELSTPVFVARLPPVLAAPTLHPFGQPMIVAGSRVDLLFNKSPRPFLTHDNVALTLEAIESEANAPDAAMPAAATTAGTTTAVPAYGYAYNYDSWSLDETIQNAFRELTYPNHNWPLLHTLSVLYILSLFPGCLIVQRVFNDYRKTYAALLLVIIGFGSLYSYVGRRGYGEDAIDHSISVAIPLRGGEWDVTTRATTFATIGGEYKLSFPGESHLWDGGTVDELVDARLPADVQTSFDVDIPPFSWRPYIHRMKAKMPAIDFEVVKLSTADANDELELKLKQPLPEGATVHVIMGSRVYSPLLNGETLTVQGAAQTPAGVFFRSSGIADGHPSGLYRSRWGDESRRSPDAIYGEATTAIYALSNNLEKPSDADRFQFPANRARLMILAPIPDQLKITDQRITGKQGRVVYLIDILSPTHP